VSFESDDRRWLSDLVMSTVESVQRRNPPPEYKAGKVIVNDTNSVKGIAVQLDDSASVIYPDNITGQPLLLNERVMVMMMREGAFIVGRWIAPHIPHSTFTRTGTSTTSTGSSTYASIPGAGTFNFTKYRKDTKLVLDMWCSGMYISGNAGSHGCFGLLINGVTYDVFEIAFSPINDRRNGAGVSEVTAGVLDAGVYTITARWKCTVLAGPLQTDIEALVGFRVTEMGI